ncbi:MAG: sulfur carrier protein ThiS [Verrucomicrobia bacterium]|jgi:thiamine biosynthesis protein ThiS|nr:MAG: sulfur carrier protein ThiS [Verrucomicrobiota bacterium]MDH4469614.1 sulfur carrier protein ThiS [Verrucomicrobiae bacterium]
MVSIQLNGKERFVEALTLVELLKELKLPISTVLVEQNGLALLRSELEKASLKSGDQIEILSVVAGG